MSCLETAPPPVGTTNSEAAFRRGEVVQQGDDEYVVLANEGSSGRVCALDRQGATLSAFPWVQHGAPARRTGKHVLVTETN